MPARPPRRNARFIRSFSSILSFLFNTHGRTHLISLFLLLLIVVRKCWGLGCTTVCKVEGSPYITTPRAKTISRLGAGRSPEEGDQSNRTSFEYCRDFAINENIQLYLGR